MDECPSLLATLAVDTPANKSREACVCLRPCMDITGTLACLHLFFSIEFTVELYIIALFMMNIGSSLGRFFNSWENCIIVCQSRCIFLIEDLFFVGIKPPFSL